MDIPLKRFLAFAESSESNIFGVHIPKKDTTPPQHIQEELIANAKAKRERKNRKRLHDNFGN